MLLPTKVRLILEVWRYYTCNNVVKHTHNRRHRGVSKLVLKEWQASYTQTNEDACIRLN